MTDILIVDDEPDIREMIGDILEDEGFQTRRVGSAQDCLDAIAEKTPKLLILDIWLKDSDIDGIDILKQVKVEHPSIPVVIISGHGNIEIAVIAIKQGAYDFIEKPFNIDHLLVVIKRAFETSRLRHENSMLKQKDMQSFVLVGVSHALKLLKQQLDKVAKSNGRVLLTGPFGTGREACAQYIHSNSSRRQKPLETVNCSLFSDEEIIKMIFGCETQSDHLKKGAAEKAHGGTLYLEDVEALSLECQNRLMKLLVENRLVRDGGKVEIPVDIRILSSTQKDLSDLIAQGDFREDLFSRLNVVPIKVPKLEDRRDDIPNLVQHFIEQFHEQDGYGYCDLDEDAMAMVQTFPWPRNIHQLRNFVERLLILSDGSGTITKSQIPSDEGRVNVCEDLQSSVSNFSMMPLREAREHFEREYLNTQVVRYSGNISKTAQFVGMERSALHRKLKSLGISTSSREEG